MKKLYLLILFLTTFGLSSFSQSGIYSGGVSKVVQHDLRKTGWIVRPEIGYEINHYYDDDPNATFKDLSIAANIGHQLIPHIFVGGGLGYYHGLFKHYHYNPVTGIGSNYRFWFFPVYANTRWYWLSTPSSPFLELQLGFRLSNYKDDWKRYYYIGGEYLGDVLEDYMYRKLKIGLHLQLSIGYNIKNYDIKIGTNLGSYVFQCRDIYGGLFLQIGYNYMLK